MQFISRPHLYFVNALAVLLFGHYIIRVEERRAQWEAELQADTRRRKQWEEELKQGETRFVPSADPPRINDFF